METNNTNQAQPVQQVQTSVLFADPSHDLFLHPSDNPNNILVSDPLNGKNYGTWKKSVEIALIAKNKLGFVLGTCTKPDASSPFFSQWDRCDKMVISWLLHAVEKRISDSILFSSSSRQIWLDLEQRFGQSDGTKFFQVKKDLYSISQGNNDIAAYFTEIKKLWDEHDSMLSVPTCLCGTSCATYVYDQKMKKKDKLIQLLVGLNDVYKGVSGNILMSRPLPNVSEAYYMLLQEEHQREMSSEIHTMPQSAALNTSLCSNNQEPVSFLSKNVSNNSYTSGKNGGFYNNGSNTQGHDINRGNLSRGFAPKRQFFCDHCKMSGHSIQKCYKIHGYPPGHKLYRGKKVTASVTQHQDGVSWLEEFPLDKQQQQQNVPAVALPTLNAEQYQQLLTLLSKQQEGPVESFNGTGFMAGKPFCFSTSFKDTKWIIDSGASDHITPHFHLLTSVSQLKTPGFITMPNGKQSKITHVGSVQLTPTLLLTNVLLVPDFQFNLLSVHKLCQQITGKVIFTPSNCILQGLTSQEVVLGEACNGLYQVHCIFFKLSSYCS